MQALEERLEDIRTPMDVSVIGCKVNGPGKLKKLILVSLVRRRVH